jgi:heat shock protein HslJ
MDYILAKIAVLEEALAIESGRESGGVSLDLCGNTGGWLTLYETMVSYFFTADDPMRSAVFDWYTYDQETGEHVLTYAIDYMLSAPRPELASTGPVVVLVDEGCASACEYFSQHLQVLGRATVVGQYPSSGAGGPIERVEMPGQIKFQFTKGKTTFAGTDEPNLEARGVIPDIRVPVTLETELAKMQGEDPVMEAALAALDELSAQLDAAQLSSTTWQWMLLVGGSQQQMTIENPEDYTVTFSEDGAMAIVADCNQANASYTEDAGSLTIEVGPMTMAACPPGSHSDQFVELLGSAAGYFVRSGTLYIELVDDGGTMLFISEGEADMAGGAASGIEESTAIPVDELRNATYSGIYDEPVTLTDGRWEDEPFTVQYLDGSELYTDLDGDGAEDAVVFLLERGGGTANIIYMGAQLNEAGQPVDAGAVRLDEVQIKSVSADDGQIQLEVITVGPGDGDCCPTHKASRTYAFQDGGWVDVSEEGQLAQVSAGDLNGTSWTLVELNYDTPVLADAEVTINFVDGQISGVGGCNNYNSSFSLGEDNPFVMTLSPVVSTKKACPDPMLDVETAYLTALENVAQWGYEFGDLALYYMDDQDVPARLFFTPAGDSG